MSLFQPAVFRPRVVARYLPSKSGVAGTLTTNPLKNNTGTVLASEIGITVYVYQTSGALVATKTGQTTDASGVMTITDPSILAATAYRIVIVLASSAEGMDTITAS